jgi:hypothetical protein
MTEEQPSIKCLQCGHVSYNKNDIEQKYCGFCHGFHTNLALVLDPPNTMDAPEQMWAFLSEDTDGHEALCGAMIVNMGLQPLCTMNPDILEKMKPIARELQKATRKRIKLVRWTKRQEMVFW